MARKAPVKRARKKALPDWAMAPFFPFLEHIQEIGRLLHLSMRGISSLRARPQVEEVLAQADKFMAKYGGVEQPSREGRLQKAQEEAHLAQTEVDNDFPQLHAQAVIAGWGALERWSARSDSSLASEPTFCKVG